MKTQITLFLLLLGHAGLTQTLFVPGGTGGIGHSNSRGIEFIDGSIRIKSDPYSVFGIERSNGANLEMGITSGTKEGFILSNGSIKFLTNADAVPKVFIHENGNVGIGTKNPTGKLTVAGNIHSREVKVTIDAGADFVFENDYDMMRLEKIAAFVNKKKASAWNTSGEGND